MSINIPLDVLADTSVLAPTAVNFPALKHYFPFTELSGTTLTDTINGVEMAVDSISGDGNKAVVTDSANSSLAAGNWVTINTKSVIIVSFTDYLYDTGIEIGGGPGTNIADDAFGVITTQGAWNVSESGGTASSVASGVALAPAGAAAVYVHNTTLTSHGVVSSSLAYSVDATPGDATGISFSGKGPNSSSRLVSPNNMYGLLIFYWDTLPGDIKTALQWMTNEWINNGNKAIYPGWKDRS